MTRSLRSPAYQRLCAALAAARRASGLSQAEVARRLGGPQSFVSKYEAGERRLDVVEFLEAAEALETDPLTLLREVRKSDPAR